MPQLLDPNTDVSTLPSFMSRSAVEQRINQLLQYMSRPDSALSTRRRLRELSSLLATYPDAIHYAVANRAIQTVIRLNQRSEELMVRQHSNQVLALLGYCEPPKGNGIRILSIDGGGTRGILVIEILRELERLSGKPVHEMFDLICGVSTGAIIGMLLGAMRTPIDECEEYYHRFSSHLFKSDFLRGAGRLIWSHAYYDTTVWEKILKDIYGETLMMESKQCAGTPSVLAISALMNKPSIEAFLFRNYELPIHTRSLSQYEGSSKYKIWQAVRASAAAPGYFEEIRLDQYVHQDGGLLINNPTAVAVHEAKMLWPSEHIQCVLSLGSGRFVPQLEEPPSRTTSLKTKIIKLIDSATDTEMVDRLMKDLLPPKTYFRINPYLTEMGTLDENRREKLDQMKADARKYLRKNDNKFTEAVTELTQKRKVRQHLEDWLRLQYYLRV
ncbi:unnamed protein product [Medioppia subpectinata]|uniref:PNPLA domain-containing protein n=1 Tax=Medioppia subpectinata TaxID=1979941 RepID=A0A7R9L8P3_9ACAR|nr:unnamed protein product [Medioppia subpectinata]CAG2116450.1 unnamed protein product [Medioppia subpectinata]